MRLLLTGDLHVGRRASRLPAWAPDDLRSCAAHLERLVDCALRHDVDAVLLSGDLVDRDNRFFEAVGPLGRALRRLNDRGVRCLAVAGNHDHDVLPELADRMRTGDGTPCLTLVGRGSRWERVTIVDRRGAPLHVDGWSFASEHVRERPLETYALPADPAVPTIGLLHADLDVPASPYAPVSLAELRATSASLWLLGHVHAPRLVEGAVPVLYPGSPLAMDPGESGAHGVWIADVEPGAPMRPRLVALSPVRYESLEVALDGVERIEQLRGAVLDAIDARARAAAAEGEGLRCLSLRVRATGATPAWREVAGRLADLEGELDAEVMGVRVAVERVEVTTRAPADHAALAQRNDVVGALARLVAAIEREETTPTIETLMRDAERSAATARRARGYLAIADDHRGIDADELRELLRLQGMRLLDELLAQRETCA